MTVAFEIRSPIKRKSEHFPNGYRNSLITIWHVDPEADGSDDSCGWSSPKLTGTQRKQVKTIAKEDYNGYYDPGGNAKVSQLDIIYTLFTRISRHMFKESIKPKNLNKILMSITNPWDNYSYFVKGRIDKEEFERLVWLVTRNLLRIKRKWWQHPKWHIHHWKIQIHFAQNFKRWAFSRCCKCGGMFRWGEFPTGHWNSTGPRWFKRGDSWHGRCDQYSQVKIDSNGREKA